MQWWHLSCIDIDESHYELLTNNSNLLYKCDKCKNCKGETNNSNNSHVSDKNEKSDTDTISNRDIFEKMSSMMVTMEKLLANQDKVTKSNSDLSARVNKLEKQGNGVSEKQIESVIEKKLDGLVDEKINEAVREQNEQEARKLNLILVNIPENSGDNSKEKDKETVEKLIKKIVQEEEISIEQINRLGEKSIDNRPRLLKIKVKTMDLKRKILKNASKLNDDSENTDPKKRIYINVDYTKKQRDLNKALREELRNMPTEEREKYMIRSNKIVLRENNTQRDPK